MLAEVFGPDISIKLSPAGGYNDVRYTFEYFFIPALQAELPFCRMPHQESLDTYFYFITKANKLNPMYFTLIHYHPSFNVEFDGMYFQPNGPFQFRFSLMPLGMHRATIYNIFKSYCPYIENAKLILNSSIQPEEDEGLLASGKVDTIHIRFNWNTHPNLATHVGHRKPLDNIPDIPHLQTKASNVSWSKGYTNYSIAVY